MFPWVGALKRLFKKYNVGRGMGKKIRPLHVWLESNSLLMCFPKQLDGLVWAENHVTWEGLKKFPKTLTHDSLVTCTSTERWCVDIREVHGISVSKRKEDGSKCNDLEELAQEIVPSQYVEVSRKQLAINSGERITGYQYQYGIDDLGNGDGNGYEILRKIRCDFGNQEVPQEQKWSALFFAYDWHQNGAVYWINGNGSRHFTSTRYVAMRLVPHVPVTLYGRSNRYRLNERAIEDLARSYEFLVVLTEEHNRCLLPVELIDILDGIGISSTMDTGWSLALMPRNFLDGGRLLTFRKESEVEMEAARLFRKAGAFDFLVYLMKEASAQRPVGPSVGEQGAV